MIDEFIYAASRVFTQARANFSAGMDAIKDDLGYQKIEISPEYTKAENTFNIIIKRASLASKIITQLIQSLTEYADNLCNVSTALLEGFSDADGLLYQNSLNFNNRCIALKKRVDKLCKIDIRQQLLSIFKSVEFEAGHLFNVKSDIKGNYFLYTGFKKEYVQLFGNPQISYDSFEDIRKNMATHEAKYKKSLKEFIESTNTLDQRFRLLDPIAIERYSNLFLEFENAFKECVNDFRTENPSLFQPEKFYSETPITQKESAGNLENQMIQYDEQILN